MAELRYQITDMLEQERKRRACIEQASLQRIEELESQVVEEIIIRTDSFMRYTVYVDD